MIMRTLIYTISCLLLFGFVNGDTVTERIQKPTVTRTQLRVSKSLNPEDMQELNVRSNNGGFATILVKKRDGKSTSSNVPDSAKVYNFENNLDSSQQITRLNPVDNHGSWTPVKSNKEQFKSYTYAMPENQRSADLINSFMQHVEHLNSAQNARALDTEVEQSIKNDRSPVHIAVSSTKVPTEDEKKYLRVPEPVFISSEPVWVKGESQNADGKRGRSIMSIDSDGIPVVQGVRMPDDEQDKTKTWRNARVINGELVPYEQGYKPTKVEPYGELVFVGKNKESTNGLKNIGPFMKTDNFEQKTNENDKNLGPFTVEDNLRNESTEHSGLGPFTIFDNSKVANSKLIAYIKKINEKESRRDYFAGRSNRFFDQEDDYQPEYHSVQPQMQRRMLQNPGNPIYSTSLLYSSPKYQQANEQFTDGIRTPVLEYAHPEFGVQAAKAVPVATEGRQNQKVQYYSKDFHNDRSPYSAEPAMSQGEYYPGEQDAYNKQFHHDKYSFKNTATYPYNYGYLRKVKEQPFYMKFAEQMRDSFQNSFATVHEITRPVIDPLVEAGQKISKNLGFSKENPQEAQDKVGVVVPAAAVGSTFMPAIGLVAGGAALGLGAMAVGRIFDGNMLRRSDDSLLMDMEHKRALEALQNGQDVYVVMEESSAPSPKRLRRSVDDFHMFNENQGSQLIRVKRKQDRSFDATYKNDKYDEVVEVFDMTNDDNLSTSPEDIEQIIELAKLTDSTQNKNSLSEEQHLISKRSLSDDEDDHLLLEILQDVEQDQPSQSKFGFEEQIRRTDWSNTPCAKKVFCEVMLQQSSDEMVLMEKKMDTLLAMMHPSLGDNLSEHLSDVTSAIHRRDCSPFVCYQR